jgi:hypothetical protein
MRFWDHYTERFGEDANERVKAAAEHIAASNIMQGDALRMTTVGDSRVENQPLILTEWGLRVGGKFARRLYEYRELTQVRPSEPLSLFDRHAEPITDEDGKPVFLVQHVRDLPIIHYLKLADGA